MNIDPMIIDLTRGITYKRADLTRWQKIKIFFGFMKEPPKIKVNPTMLCDLIPRVTNMMLSGSLPKQPEYMTKIGSVA